MGKRITTDILYDLNIPEADDMIYAVEAVKTLLHEKRVIKG